MRVIKKYHDTIVTRRTALVTAVMKNNRKLFDLLFEQVGVQISNTNLVCLISNTLCIFESE